jgi:hypothetical protein
MKLIFLFNVFCFIIIIQINKVNNASVGLPIGLLIHNNDTKELVPIIERLKDYINSGSETKWAFQIHVLNTYDESELLNALCNQMKRGVLGIFGETNMFTLDSVKSFVTYYNVPFYTWSYPNSDSSSINQELSTTTTTKITDDDDDENYTGLSDDEIMKKKQNKKKKSPDISYLFNMYPTLSELLVSLLKYHKWENIFYIYDNDEALIRIQSMLEYQTRDKDFVTNINC